MVDRNKFYGVFILKDDIDQNLNEKLHVYSRYEDAHKVIKEHKNARFKCFNGKEEASFFARYGSASGPGNPSVISESISYKSLKRQEIYQFRKYIEINDLKSVELLVSENPRYLIGIGDTPTIMQEGARYNALHIAAKHNRSEIADFILRTVGNKSFCQQLYGSAGDNSYLVRPEVMLDFYLNTPDKALNETPLHFAAKYGAYDVVVVFVQYPQLQLQVKNKYGQTPKDIACKSPNPGTVNVTPNDIQKLLDELFFVPVWRSEDEVIQPVIGKPFSPKSPPICPLTVSPLSPNMEIKAVAGPMNYTEATNFHKTWKSPAKNSNCSTSLLNRGILLRSPLNAVKGLEQVGRSLAKKFHVSWKEYWPFLDRFVDLSSEEGLVLLNEYLKQIVVPKVQSSKISETFPITSPMSELCNAFSKCSIDGTVNQSRLNINKTKSNIIRKINFSFSENENNDEKNSISKVTISCANSGSNDCDNGMSDSDSDDAFHSTLNSPANSEEEWESADEGPEIYIFDNKGTSMDNAVLEAISGVHIHSEKYPFIYQWKHFINSHCQVQRLSWPSPKATPYKRMKLMRDRC